MNALDEVYRAGKYTWLANGYKVNTKTRKVVGRWCETKEVCGQGIRLWPGHILDVHYLIRLYRKLENRLVQYTAKYTAAKEELYSAGATAWLPLEGRSEGRSPWLQLILEPHDTGWISCNYTITDSHPPFTINYQAGKTVWHYHSIVNKIRQRMRQVQGLAADQIIPRLPAIPSVSDTYLPVTVDGMTFQFKGTRRYYSASATLIWEYMPESVILSTMSWEQINAAKVDPKNTQALTRDTEQSTCDE